MEIWIALLKSVNVGGNNILPMKELRAIGDSLGYLDFKTYIQSGNCVFKSTKTDANIIASEITDKVFNSFGFRPPVLVMTIADLKKTIELNPFPASPDTANTVFLHFLWSKKTHVNYAEAKRLATSTENFELIDTVLYLHAPEGVARSKLYAKLPKLLSDKVTVRNLRTTSKVLDLAMAQKTA